MLTFFQIGPLHLAVEVPMELPWTRECAVFRRAALPAHADPFTYTIAFTDQFQPIRGRVVNQGRQMLVMDAEGTECRVHTLPGSGEPFALTRRLDDRHYRILIDSRARNALKWDRNLLGLMALEHDCIRLDAVLLHASCVIHDGCAVLFCGPSGQGKSTQADLWHRLRGSEIINGDRAAVSIRGGVPVAQGIPFAGSSSYCENRTAPIAAVVYLGQAPETTIRRLKGYEAFSRIWEGVSVNTWDKTDMEHVSAAVSAVASQVPVFHLPCTPDESAVCVLEDALRKLESL